MAGEQEAMLAFLGANDSFMPTGTSAAGNLNLYQDIMGMVGNPLFLYQQGLVDADTLTAMVRQATREPIDTATIDYTTLEDIAKARQDPVTARAYELIKSGASVAQVLREIAGEGASSAGKFSDKLNYDLDMLTDDLVEFKNRWDAAQGVAEGLSNGEYEQIGDVVYKPMDIDKAMAATKALGLPTFLQNPAMWEIIPDSKLLADAAVGEQQAATLAEELNRLVDENGVLRRSVDRKAVNQAASKAGSDVYRMILNTAAAGRQQAQTVAGTKERSDYEQGMFGSTISSRAAASPPVAQSSQQRTEQLKAQNLARWIADKAKQSAVKDQSSAGILQRVAPTTEKQDYWAKLGGSYAARAAAEEKRKPVATLQQRVAEAEKRAKEKAAAAYAAGRPLALDIIPQAMAAAAGISQPAPRATRPAARVLSDQEIATMANMLAGGTA